MGYSLAGFTEIVGVDTAAQPRYPFRFVQGDALWYAVSAAFLQGFDLVHVSAPCQRWTLCQRIRDNEHPDLVGPLRERLIAAGVPYVLENVPGAPLRDPVTLCGCMFDGLNVYRPRLFETSFPLAQPPHRPHLEPLVKMGRAPKPGHRMHVVGNFNGAAAGRAAMGIPWMTRDELREAIPPAFSEYVGRAFIDHQARVQRETCTG